MNDPGLDAPIANADSEIQRRYGSSSTSQLNGDGHDNQLPKASGNSLNHQSPAYSNQKSGSEDAAHELPTRWWYASTGFPLLAGTFGPMATAFSICALVENWRVDVPPGGTEEHGINIPDPKWLIAVNAVSLACALIANLSLLLNMAKRVPFRWAQPVTIIGFWLSSLLLTILVGYAAHDFRAPGVENQALTQAYYYGCWAAGLYQIISWMMCVTVYGAIAKKYSSDFNLTMAQRTLMLQTISFLAYLLIGALVYCHIENWKFLDAVYWSDFTLLTVGLGGDMTPTTHLGKGLLFPFSIGGIVALGLVVSSIRTMVLDRSKSKLHARMTEKTRRRVVKQVEQVRDAEHARRRTVTGLDKKIVNRLALDPSDDRSAELGRRRAEFDAMRRVEEMTASRQKWMNLVVSTTAFAILWFVGAVVFWQTEGANQGWSYFTSLYFSWTSLLTIGYGDYVPLSNAGRPFFVFWSLLAVPSLTILVSDMGDTVVVTVKNATIWVGEVTILPADRSSVAERLRYGVSKTMRIQMDRMAQGGDEEESGKDNENDNNDDNRSTFQQPGLIRLFKFPRKIFGSSNSDADTDRLAKDFEDAEVQEENNAKKRRDYIAEDEHHYRHVLISEIRKLYKDTYSASPKKYTYEEWAFYLKLLGEDESSSDFHRHAPIKPHGAHGRDQDTDRAQSSGSEAPLRPQQRQDTLRQWSWIGPRSPLMTRGDHSESEWLVTRLFERLEESLLHIHKEKNIVIKQQHDSQSKPHQPRPRSE